MKRKIFSIASVIFLGSIFAGCGTGDNLSSRKNSDASASTSTPAPATAKQYNYSTSTTSIISKAIVAANGGTIEITDTAASINGVSLSVPANALKSNAVITAGRVNDPPPPPVGLNFVGGPIDFGPDGTTFSTPAKIKIPFSKTQLDVAGVSSKVNLKLYVFDKTTKAWSEGKITSIDTINNIVIGQVDHFSFYTLVGLSGTPPEDLGKPQPGDALYRLSTYNNGKTSGWSPGHVGVYVGEQIWDGGNEEFVSEDVKRCGKFNVVEALIGRGVICSYYKIPNTVQSCEVQTTFEGKSVYMGAREPANFTLTEYERKMGVRFVIAQIGKPYVTDQTIGILFGLLHGINVKGLMDFNCVGLYERMFEEYGANERQGIMPDDNDKLITPAWQYSGTKPAGGADVSPVINWAKLTPSSGTRDTFVVAQISVSHFYGLGQIDSVTYATDEGFVNPSIIISDSGTAGDEKAGDGIYSSRSRAGGDNSKGSMGLTFTVVDKAGKSASIRLVYTYTSGSGYHEVAPKQIESVWTR